MQKTVDAATLAQAALDRHAAGLLGLDRDRHVVLCNQPARDLLGVPAGCAPPLPAAAFVAQAGRLDAAARAILLAALESPGQAGTPPAMGARLALAATSGQGFGLHVECLADGSALATLTRDLGGVPPDRTDALTGLSDRRWFRDSLATMLQAAGGESRVAVLMIDLDGFKAVNDTHGHPIGDAVLQVVAQRLRSAVRTSDVVSRLGGDEFGVALPMPAGAEATALRLVDLLSRPYLVEGHVAVIGASIGIATGPRDAADAAGLVRCADLALYQAKEAGRRAVRVFDEEMDQRARAHHALLEDLRRALPLQQFEVYYQPQVDLGSGALSGFEALVRWRHPRHGLVPPDRFIPLAEEMDLIIPIGEWVLRTACLEAASWPETLSVAVNVSAKQLQSVDRLPKAVAEALAQARLAPHRLEVEITESALVRYEKTALQVLLALRGMGVRVSMDDFGTGYSSLSQLRSFPFDKLKIDRSFVRDLAGNTEALAVIRAIAALGTSLGMTTTAEGVETPEQEELVQAEGCTHMQGYLTSRPVPAFAARALIENHTGRKPGNKVER